MRIAICAVLAASLLACKSKPEPAPEPETEKTPSTPPVWYDSTRSLYNGIPVTVRFQPKNERAAEEVWAYLKGIDDIFNSYRPDSEVGKLNQIAAHDDPVPVSGQMAEALTFSLELFEMTDGAFDITVAPLVRLWAKAAEDDVLPTEAAIKKTLADVGLAVVAVKNGQLTVSAPRRAFDFGGVIKGVAADRAAAMLRDAGADGVFVQVGNETVAFGFSPKGAPTTLAIDNPKDMDTLYERIADPGSGISATTTTNVHQPRKIAGKTYYHIVDPRSGKPVDIRTLSVTVAFPAPGKAGLCDGLATAVAVLGPKRGIEIVEKAGGEALILTEKADGTFQRHQTYGWKRFTPKR